jgi:hypothetical protein
MSTNVSNTGNNRHKMIEFIPFKTMFMDLESILANLLRIYVSRNDVELAEIVTMADAELFPIGNFDAEAEKYEYVLKLAIPAKYHFYLHNKLKDLQPQLQKDITIITAAYKHEFISTVFVVIKIDQDAGWRNAVMEWVMSQPNKKKKEFQLFLCHTTPDEETIIKEMKAIFLRKEITVYSRAITSVKEKDIQHLLTEFENLADFGVLVMSPTMVALPFASSSVEQLTGYVCDPRKKFCQIWNNISRTDVAAFSAGLARSLAYSTELMPIEQICGLLLAVMGYPPDDNLLLMNGPTANSGESS